MKREEMLERMRAANQDGKSKLHMRSENIQNRFELHRIPMLKKALKKKSKLLLICDLAIPFNPETGEEEEDGFNADNKYRPPFSAKTVALSLKELADTNPVTKEAFMRRAGVTEWDTSDYETFTDQDWSIFVKYRVPRIFTVPVVHINIPVMTKGNFGADYSISVQRDPMTGEVIGEVPAVLRVDKLFRDKLYEEVQEFNKALDSGELKLTDKQVKERRSQIYQKNPVSSEHPSNWVMMIELPVDSKYQLSADIDYASVDAAKIKSSIVITRLPKKLKSTIESYVRGDYEKFDKHFDYFEVDMGCPVEGDDATDQGKMAIGQDTTFDKPSYNIDECLSNEMLEKLEAAITDCLDDYLNVEEEVRRSMWISPYTEDVENQLYTALPTVLDIENDKYITQSVLEANREVINIAFGGVGTAMLDDLDAGCSEAAIGVLDEKASKEESKTYSVSELDADDGVDLEEVGIDIDGIDDGMTDAFK